ncbi:F-box and WD-40 domain protein 7 [Enteropsectra breve]|nr:F-box and WD-40 domain protein 7 [Enteropsectra breve]
MNYKKQKKEEVLYLGLLPKILASSKLGAVKTMLPYQIIGGCLSVSDTVWNGYAKTKSKDIGECIKILKNRNSLHSKIKNGGYSSIDFRTHQSDLTEMRVADGHIYCSSDDRTIKSYDFAGKLVSNYFGHLGGVWAFEVRKDMIVSGSTDKTARIWSTKDQTTSSILKSHRSTIRTVKCHGKFIVTGSRDYSIIVWLSNGTMLYVLQSHSNSVRCMDISEKYLVSGSYDCTVKLWDYRKGIFLRDISIHNKRVYIVKIHKDIVASSGMDAEVKIVSVDQKISASHNAHSKLVAWLDFHENSVISSGADCTVVKYNYVTKKVEYVITEITPIKAQKICEGLLIIGTQSAVKIYTLSKGVYVSTLMCAENITKIEMVDKKIIVGYYVEGKPHIRVFDYNEYENC